MPERKSYVSGTPNWVDLQTTDQAAAKQFYSGLFGWDFDDQPIDAANGVYYSIATLNGLDVGAIAPPDATAVGVPPHWNSYVSVDDVDAVAAAVAPAGGTVIAPPFDVMDAGRMAVLQDPTGAVFQVWEPKQHVGTRIQREPGSLCWTELVTTDTKAAQTFYTSLFGWAAKTGGAQPDEYTEFSVNGVPGAGMMAIRPEWGPNIPAHWTPYFQVSDCDASAAKARALGAEVGVPPTDIPNVGRFAMLADPQGAKFAIFTPGRAS